MDTKPRKIAPREKILLVDDQPANLAVLTAALEPEGYEILAAPDGLAETFLRHSGLFSPDLAEDGRLARALTRALADLTPGDSP